MARKVNTEKEKKKKKKKTFFIILFLLIILGAGGFFSWKYIFNDKGPRTVKTIKEIGNISEYGYTLTDKDSKYYKAEFKELEKILKDASIDNEKYATQVAKMFVIDLYTIDTKVNKYDVGGIEFFYADKKDMFAQKVIDSLYSALIDDTYGDREQSLPEVSNVEVKSTEETSYMLGENKVDGYLVKLSIEYKTDMEYDDEASVLVVNEKNSKRWSVVDYQPTLNPKYEKKDTK